MYTTEQLVVRWEDQRAIKNLMGKYANCVILNREQDIYGLFWSKGEDVSLMFNDGAYVGAQAVSAYYAACHDRNALVAKLMRDKFPEILGGRSDEEIYGVGPFKVKPMACPVIEVAGDGKTAKGLWYCQGAYNDVETCGPVARWTWGYFAADFVKEDGSWKLWHLQYLNDVDCICGQSWAGEQVPYPDLPEFAPLADFHYPEYTVKKTFRALYSADRPVTLCPEIPRPYDSFAATFSYGVEKEA